MAMTVLHNRRAVHDNGFHPRGMSLDFLSVNDVRQLLADQIVDLVGVEDRHIRGHSFFQQAAIEAKSLCREAGELVDRLLEVEEIFLAAPITKSEEHTSELQSLTNIVCRLLLEKKNIRIQKISKGVAATVKVLGTGGTGDV